MCSRRREYKTAEILVLGDEQPALSIRESNDGIVFDAAHRLGNGNDIMSEAPQLPDHREVAALVSDETHGR